MSKSYTYPLDYSWSYEDMTTVIQLWNKVEEAYEKGVSVEAFLKAYRDFKNVVPSKGEEKQLSREFEKIIWVFVISGA